MRVLGAALFLLSVVQPALGGHGPVCWEPSVIDEMGRQVRAASYYAQIDPRLTSEQPTSDPNVLRCQVCVLVAPYDTPRYGNRPVPFCAARSFDVQVVGRGFVVGRSQ